MYDPILFHSRSFCSKCVAFPSHILSQIANAIRKVAFKRFNQDQLRNSFPIWSIENVRCLTDKQLIFLPSFGNGEKTIDLIWGLLRTSFSTEGYNIQSNKTAHRFIDALSAKQKAVLLEKMEANPSLSSWVTHYKKELQYSEDSLVQAYLGKELESETTLIHSNNKDAIMTASSDKTVLNQNHVAIAAAFASATGPSQGELKLSSATAIVAKLEETTLAEHTSVSVTATKALSDNSYAAQVEKVLVTVLNVNIIDLDIFKDAGFKKAFFEQADIRHLFIVLHQLDGEVAKNILSWKNALRQDFRNRFIEIYQRISGEERSLFQQNLVSRCPMTIEQLRWFAPHVDLFFVLNAIAMNVNFFAIFNEECGESHKKEFNALWTGRELIGYQVKFFVNLFTQNYQKMNNHALKAYEDLVKFSFSHLFRILQAATPEECIDFEPSPYICQMLMKKIPEQVVQFNFKNFPKFACAVMKIVDFSKLQQRQNFVHPFSIRFLKTICYNDVVSNWWKMFDFFSDQFKNHSLSKEEQQIVGANLALVKVLNFCNTPIGRKSYLSSLVSTSHWMSHPLSYLSIEQRAELWVVLTEVCNDLPKGDQQSHFANHRYEIQIRPDWEQVVEVIKTKHGNTPVIIAGLEEAEKSNKMRASFEAEQKQLAARVEEKGKQNALERKEAKVEKLLQYSAHEVRERIAAMVEIWSDPDRDKHAAKIQENIAFIIDLWNNIDAKEQRDVLMETMPFFEAYFSYDSRYSRQIMQKIKTGSSLTELISALPGERAIRLWIPPTIEGVENFDPRFITPMLQQMIFNRIDFVNLPVLKGYRVELIDQRFVRHYYKLCLDGKRVWNTRGYGEGAQADFEMTNVSRFTNFVNFFISQYEKFHNDLDRRTIVATNVQIVFEQLNIGLKELFTTDGWTNNESGEFTPIIPSGKDLTKILLCKEPERALFARMGRLKLLNLKVSVGSILTQNTNLKPSLVLLVQDYFVE